MWVGLLIGYLIMVALFLIFFKGCNQNEEF